MLLTIDIGNTSTTIGVFEGEKLSGTWTVSTDIHRSEDEIGVILISLLNLNNCKEKIENASICSVVVPLTERFKNAVSKYLHIEPFIVSHKTAGLLNFNVDFPEEVGPDRIVNAFAAYSLYKKTSIVVDLGTATSFDIVTSQGVFQGGIICAGMKIQAESLKKFTSKLPLIKIEASKTVVGKNTIDAMLSGIVRGHAKMVEGLIEECENELGTKALILATGGYANIIAGYMNRSFDYICPYLTLEGLRLIFDSHAKLPSKSVL